MKKSIDFFVDKRGIRILSLKKYQHPLEPLSNPQVTYARMSKIKYDSNGYIISFHDVAAG